MIIKIKLKNPNPLRSGVSVVNLRMEYHLGIPRKSLGEEHKIPPH